VSESFTTADGRTLAYRRAGSGPPLLCHPGGPGWSSRYFAGDLGGLGERLELLLLDPRGTGGSDRPQDARAYRIPDYVADLEAFRAHLGLERASVLGHSHGGVVAMAYAAEHPDRVERLVLACTLPRFAGEQEAAMTAAMERQAGEPWYADARAALEEEQAASFASDEELAAVVRRELPFYFARFGNGERAYVEESLGEVPNGDALRLFNDEIFETFDLRPDLARVEAPALVITGEEDFICGPLCAAEIAERVAGAETVLLPDTGHFAFVESPERFREAVWRFLGV
jgi:pimeloyl-ACP methyl ester carboxylesterase